MSFRTWPKRSMTWETTCNGIFYVFKKPPGWCRIFLAPTIAPRLSTWLFPRTGAPFCARPCPSPCSNIADETVAATYCHPGTDHAPCDRPQETVTVLQDTDLERLRQTNEYLHLTGAGRFAPLLRPVDREGTRDFYLFPIFVRGNLAGLLVIAYVQVSVPHP